MATSSVGAESEVPLWLRNLPLAPEFHPTLGEFQDPISYILKIEKDAAKYGICKIIPPISAPPKKTAITQLNRSLSARNPNSVSKILPTFTTRHQQIGFCHRKPRPIQKPVWQSGEAYTVQQFEAKAKAFERSYLKKSGKKVFSELEIEGLFWKASLDKPFTVEYANDMPGSAFVSINEKKWRESGLATTVGETVWNMRGVSRHKESLLRFMKEDIPGVTSPMVYLAMLFSWFAWHVEDHDLHSLNYLHMGAGKTWYGVPKDAAVAFEEVIRVHGYGGEVNPLVTFATLGERTTVLSPEVLIGAGIPCCRLVQNVGEFVVTFPRAYHSGFSHGFNCGEAANIATPEWLTVANEAAIRRASINCPPMVSHLQLLYTLALSLRSSIPRSISSDEPRSSRLKNKKRSEGQTMIKELFVQNMIQNNHLIHLLIEQGASCVLLPQSSLETFECSNLGVGSQVKVKPRLSLGLCTNKESLEASKTSLSNVDRNMGVRPYNGVASLKGKSNSEYGGNRLSSSSLSRNGSHGNTDLSTSTSTSVIGNPNKTSTSQSSRLIQQGLFTCVTCGILTFGCAAVIQPSDAASRYLRSADCGFFNEWVVGSGDRYLVAEEVDNTPETNHPLGQTEKSDHDDLHDVEMVPERVKLVLDTGAKKDVTSLDLLAFAYGNSSESEDDNASDRGERSPFHQRGELLSNSSGSHSLEHDSVDATVESSSYLSRRQGYATNRFIKTYQRSKVSDRKQKQRSQDAAIKGAEAPHIFSENNTQRLVHGESFGDKDSSRNTMLSGYVESHQGGLSNSSPRHCLNESSKSTNAELPSKNTNMLIVQSPDADSTRKHIFCLEHAVEVENQLRPIGGVHMLLICNPEYSQIQVEAKSLSEEMGINKHWKAIPFIEASKDDIERTQSALYDEEAIAGNGDWSVKLGVNLYYSVSLSQSPIYSKQMPYNPVIYKAFGRRSPAFNSPTDPEYFSKGSGKKKIFVAGRWCGKVWMSNQVHPYLVDRQTQEEGHPITFHSHTVREFKLEGIPNMAHLTEQLLVPKKKLPPRARPTAIVNIKPTRKRKNTPEKPATKRRKSSQLDSRLVEAEVETGDDAAAEESSAESDSPPLRERLLRSSRAKHETPRHLSSTLRGGQRYDSNMNIKYEIDDEDEAAEELSPESDSSLLRESLLRSGGRMKVDIEDEDEDEAAAEELSPESDFPLLPKRPLRSGGRMKHETPRYLSSTFRCGRQYDSNMSSKDEIEVGYSSQLRRTPQKCCVAEEEQEEEEEEENIPTARTRRTSQTPDVSEEEEEEEDSTPSRQPRIRTSWKPVIAEEEEDNICSRRPRRRTSRKPVITEEEEEEEEEEEDNIPSRGPRRRTSWKPVIAEEEEEEEEEGEEDNIHSRRPRRTSWKTVIAEEEEEEEEEDNIPSRRPRRGTSWKPVIAEEEEQEEEEEDNLVIVRGKGKRRVKGKLKPEEEKKPLKRARKVSYASSRNTPTLEDAETEAEYQCNVEGCTMGFSSKQELSLHKKNICSVKGCGKSFFSHKYLMQHRRVHSDDRPLKCPVRGCMMTFKWPWSRTEHIRVHTGDRPYQCHDCNQSFRFVSDFSRHKRKTGHSVKKKGRGGKK